MNNAIIYTMLVPENHADFLDKAKSAVPDELLAGITAKTPLKQSLSVMARLLLSRAVCGDLRLDFGQNGKPFFVNNPVCFSLSHSGLLCACAVCGGEIGLDIEKMRPINNEIARRFFSAGESGFLDAIDNEDERKNAFFTLWTLKEAALKASGESLAEGLEKYCFGFEGENFFPLIETKSDFFHTVLYGEYSIALFGDFIGKPVIKTLDFYKIST